MPSANNVKTWMGREKIIGVIYIKMEDRVLKLRKAPRDGWTMVSLKPGFVIANIDGDLFKFYFIEKGILIGCVGMNTRIPVTGISSGIYAKYKLTLSANVTNGNQAPCLKF
tara:strand:- start:346 stop:678 length:333 start_codon:yes stop_codon:yes gene_type:complete